MGLASLIVPGPGVRCMGRTVDRLEWGVARPVDGEYTLNPL